MKTVFFKLLTICLIAFSPSLKAQSLSLQGGLNVSHWGGDQFAELDDPGLSEFVSRPMKLGFQIEALLEFPISKKISLNSGLRFNQISWQVNIDEMPDFGISSETTYSLNLLELPLNLRYNQQINRKLKAYGSAGAYFGGVVAMAAEVKFMENGQTETDRWSDLADEFILDFGLDFGGGIEYKNWLAGLSYRHGYVGREGDFFTTGVISLNLGYRIF